MGLLLALLIAVPLVEIYVMIQVGQWIGALNMVGLLLLVSIGGIFLVKHQGIGVFRRIRGALDAGRVPGPELLDAALLLVAGLLLVIPGFVTDFFGLLLLLPPVRALVRGFLRRRLVVRVATHPYQYRRTIDPPAIGGPPADGPPFD
jgi:UPF0716 protein FxsA